MSPSTINVVVCGASGVGKSSVINLIAQNEVARVSADVDSCTMESARYDIQFDGLNFTIFDTPPFEDHQLYGVDCYLEAAVNAYELVMKLSAAGGIHLLLFSLVVTNLEREKEMKDWWKRNKNDIERYGFKSDGHACITTVKRAYHFRESQTNIRNLLKDFALKTDAFTLDTRSWFAQLRRGMGSFIAMNMKPSLKEFMKVSKKRFKLDYDTAGRIAEAMEIEERNIYLQASQRLERLERLGDSVMYSSQGVLRVLMIEDGEQNEQRYDETLSTYSATLSLVPSPSNTVAKGWARLALVHCSVDRALAVATKFKLPKFHVCRAICDVLEEENRVPEAVEYLRRIQNGLSQVMSAPKERREWEINFRRHCKEKLQNLGDAAMDLRNHDEAIACYSNALSLDPANTVIIVKCCQARMGFLEDELVNATKDIGLDPPCHKGYKRKHAILCSMGRYKEASESFEMMLSCLQESPDPKIRDLRSQYLGTAPLIRQVIEDTIRDTPSVLIDITTGRLCDKALQAAAFEQLPIFNELRSSMITRDQLDYPRIRREVEMFYRYVMFSHRWQQDEPTFQMVENMSIYELPDSPANQKLTRFCHLVKYHRFRWAWSDTCCVNQTDNRVQQESVIAMFRWYRGSSLTIVHLLGILSMSQEPGSLWRSIWNTRGWTYQEYVASKVVQFYTEDWKPYLNLKIFNHKESPDILSEMERATMFTTRNLNMLQPGLDRVREKLYLASKRQTTREEDIAYSLFGIFNVAIPVIYGERKQAVGRLLEHILTRSDNVTILAWTGMSGSHHSCLPSDLTVYDQISPPHLPPLIKATEIDIKVKALRLPTRDLSLATRLYEQLDQLPPLSLVGGRLKLSGLVFPLTDPIRALERDSNSNAPVYRTTTPILGNVMIQTTDDLSGMKRLILIHPWITPLLDADFSDNSPEADLATRALRLIIRLRQPFGGLLLTSRGRGPYRRVATDSFIETRVQQKATLEELMNSIRTVDIQ